MAKKTEVIELKEIAVKHAKITICGDGDLVLNKMSDPTARALTEVRSGKAKSIEKPNMWEEIITAMHWYNGKPSEFTEESLYKELETNQPCITAFGLDSMFLISLRISSSLSATESALFKMFVSVLCNLQRKGPFRT